MSNQPNGWYEAEYDQAKPQGQRLAIGARIGDDWSPEWEAAELERQRIEWWLRPQVLIVSAGVEL